MSYCKGFPNRITCPDCYRPFRRTSPVQERCPECQREHRKAYRRVQALEHYYRMKDKTQTTAALITCPACGGACTADYVIGGGGCKVCKGEGVVDAAKR